MYVQLILAQGILRHILPWLVRKLRYSVTHIAEFFHSYIEFRSPHPFQIKY